MEATKAAKIEWIKKINLCDERLQSLRKLTFVWQVTIPYFVSTLTIRTQLYVPLSSSTYGINDYRKCTICGTCIPYLHYSSSFISLALAVTPPTIRSGPASRRSAALLPLSSAFIQLVYDAIMITSLHYFLSWLTTSHSNLSHYLSLAVIVFLVHLHLVFIILQPAFPRQAKHH